MRKIILVAVILLFGATISAQSIKLKIESSIKDVVCEKDQKERQIVIYNKTQKIYEYKSVGCEAVLQVELKPDVYTIIISSSGYKSVPTEFTITPDKSEYDIKNIILEEDVFLKEVTVSGIQKKFIKVAADKTTVNVQDNAMLNTSNAYEALRKLPGVVIAPDGTLKLNGKPISIQIDNTPNTLSGEDLKNYLTGLPASMLEKIELIYNPGAMYDANLSGSVINLVTNSKRVKGIAGNFNINYNFNKYQKPSPQIMLNGKTGNLSWNIMTGYNYIDRDNSNRNDNFFTDFNETLNYSNYTQTTNRNFYNRIGLNYKLSPKSNLLFNYNNNFSNDHQDFETLNTGSYLDDYSNKGLTKEKSSYNEYIVQLKSKLDTLGTRLSVSAYLNTFMRTPISSSTQTQNTQSFFGSRQDFDLVNYYTKADLSFPIKKWDISINSGVKYNVLTVENNGKYTQDITNSTIGFDYNEKNAAAYTEVSKSFLKNKLSATAGLRFEDFRINREALDNNETTKVDFNDSNLFPNLNLMYSINDNYAITSSYNRKIQQPYYGQLDPNNGNYFDKYNTSKGNILLNPSFYDNFELKLTAMQYISFGLYYSYVKDSNTFLTSVSQDSNGNLISNQSIIALDKKQYGINFNFPIPLDLIFKGMEEFKKRQSDMNKLNYLYMSVQYNKTTIDQYDLSFNNKGAWVFATQGQIILPWDVTSTINYFYLPTGTWEIYKVNKPIQQFDISFQKEFLNKNLKIGLHAFDLFNQNSINATISSQNVNTLFYQKDDSRVFRISLSWNFGKLKTVEQTDIEADKRQSSGGFIK